MSYTKILLHFFFTTLFLFGISAGFAQNGVITGTVIDTRTNEASIGASVFIEGTNKGAITDLSGNFSIENVPAGTYTVTASYISYKTISKPNVVVTSGKETVVDFSITPDDVVLGTVKIVARVNRESENALLLEQRQAVVSTQAVGARELSRKGIGDAQAAVAQVSGVSRQEGVKNVFVRGLGDRYNTTLLNGFPIPSEDPEYKNISLDFFGTDIIQNIGVSKVFSASDYSDVGGAVINISSKELVSDAALGIDISAGVNTTIIGTDFLCQDGSNYFGFANDKQPVNNQFDFPNKLDPATVALPLNHAFGISGGKMFKIGEKQNPLSFFVVASHSNDYSFTKETVRSATAEGLITQEQTGEKYSQTTNQLLLANALYSINDKHSLRYNFMLIHANDQYVGEYSGLNWEINQEYGQVFLRRQQTNDNLLMVNQFSSTWRLHERLNFDAGIAYNSITGSEPDRRVNYLSMQQSGNYILTGSDRQKRFYSELTGGDFNAKAALTFKLNDRFNSTNSAVKIGYVGHFSGNNFSALEYSFDAASGTIDMN
ncbi:MAG: TonB-dependent receptor, partial [Bacteroidales bacterium]|nr:TonB-dependent receptor [Bacteroidales bacterium]